MRILIAGAWAYTWYEAACADALERMGHSVIRFSWSDSFRKPLGRLEASLTLMGPKARRMNRELRACAAANHPDVVLVWRGTHILPDTLGSIRAETNALLVSYNNDDPFSEFYSRGPLRKRRLWSQFQKALPSYDLHFVYRPLNVTEMLERGARSARLLMPYFVPGVDRQVADADGGSRGYECDAIFVGHYEADSRIEHLRSIVEAGLRVRLYGSGWSSDVLGNLAGYFGPVYPLFGDDYRLALAGANTALCFLSTLNRDVYTRRCFEIPACGGLLVSERTSELTSIFAENSEALFFSSSDELVAKVKWAATHPTEAAKIRLAGSHRVVHGGHSVDDRMRELISEVGAHIAQRNSRILPTGSDNVAHAVR